MVRSRCCDYILTCLFLPWVQTCAPRQYHISLSSKQQQHHLQHQQYLCLLMTRCQGQPWLQALPQQLELKIIWNKSKHYGLIEHLKIFNFFKYLPASDWLKKTTNTMEAKRNALILILHPKEMLSWIAPWVTLFWNKGAWLLKARSSKNYRLKNISIR